MRCQTFDAPLGAKPVMTLLGSEQATTLVVVMTGQQIKSAEKVLENIKIYGNVSKAVIELRKPVLRGK